MAALLPVCRPYIRNLAFEFHSTSEAMLTRPRVAALQSAQGGQAEARIYRFAPTYLPVGLTGYKSFATIRCGPMRPTAVPSFHCRRPVFSII